jgi:hypothetical protein
VRVLNRKYADVRIHNTDGKKNILGVVNVMLIRTFRMHNSSNFFTHDEI